jgi:hypothetical protein
MPVVISVIGILAAMLMPAGHLAREVARGAACRNNMRQIGLAFFAQADTKGHRFCSGAFDWKRDGCVTEYGWVADLVDNCSLVGQILCSSNSAEAGEVYNDLINFNVPAGPSCTDYFGSQPYQDRSGASIVNPCRKLAALAPGAASRPFPRPRVSA